ncbi:Cysteine-tRNA ligase [Trinorchestia longiramus]|nr:Cysteine-tRNA ligase [Trinorchestia longiramus]
MHNLYKSSKVLRVLAKHSCVADLILSQTFSSGYTCCGQPCSNLPPWKKPSGYDTGILVYNTATKHKVPLVTKSPGHLTWYMCGPTVYDSPHVGHGLCYIRFDIIRRILRDYFDLGVFQVMGVTDVDDKIIKKANYFQRDIGEVSRHYETEFWQDMALLDIPRPDKTMRVTDHVQHIIKFVQDILKAGYAYHVADGSVFFNNIAYRKFRGLHLPDDFSPETRLSSPDYPDDWLTDAPDPHKRHPIDFVLWKASKPGEPSWPSPFGRGRPGWHIECSAMACSVFGESLDVHSGGIDLWFPHHHCEEAQCCARHSTHMWTNYWWHSGHLTIDSEKMSKSVGNVVSIRELLRSHSANTFRHFALTSHYTNREALLSNLFPNLNWWNGYLVLFLLQTVTFGDRTLEQAATQVAKIQEMLDTAQHFLRATPKVDCARSSPADNHALMKALYETKQTVDSRLRDDFDTANAMKSVLALVSSTNKYLYGNYHERILSPDNSSLSQFDSENNSHKLVSGRIVDQSPLSGPSLPSKEDESDFEILSNLTVKNVNVIPNESSSGSAGYVEVAAVRAYVLSLMKLFGMRYQTGQVSADDTVKTSSDVQDRFPDVMQAVLQYRGAVRDFALLKNLPAEQLKSMSKTEKQAKREEYSALLQAGDELRERLHDNSIIIKDFKESSSWTFSGELNKQGNRGSEN